MQNQKVVDAFFTKEAFNEYAKRLKEQQAKDVGLTFEEYNKAVLDGGVVYQQSFQPIPVQPCLHNSCPECHGSGFKLGTGEICVHHIACSCNRCTPHF